VLPATAPVEPRSRRIYRRREPEHSALYGALQSRLETFLAQARVEGDGLPKFVERELRAFLRCGILAHGFARVHCDGCGHDRLVAFSCKGRGFCPSCGGKRMTHFAAHLIDEVLPRAPVRQWVLTVPYRLRYRMAYDHALCGAIHKAFTRALLFSYRHRAAARGIAYGRTGAVTCIQRFGSALNLNPHFHTQALDGVFVEQHGGMLSFHPLRAPTNDEVHAVLEDLMCRLQPVLARYGLRDTSDDGGHEDPLAQDLPLLASVYAGSIQGQAALGERRGRRPLTLGTDTRAPWRDKALRHHARLEGFDLHASVSVPGHARDRLEQLLRYCARPALSHDRLQLLDGGRLRLMLKTPRFDGTTHLILTADELIERLVALVPRPHKNLILYTGVLAPNAKWRARVAAFGREPAQPNADEGTVAHAHARDRPHARDRRRRTDPRNYNSEWARLMRRAFELDVLRCPKCDHRMRVLALIEQPSTARRVLRHLGMRDHAPPIAPARLTDTTFDDVA
jgi:hypothetical protein